MAGSIGGMSADDDDITEELLADFDKLTGLSLELLGLDPHPDDMTPEQRLLFDPEDLAGSYRRPRARPAERRAPDPPAGRPAVGTPPASSSTSSSAIWAPSARWNLLPRPTSPATSGPSSLPPQLAASYDPKFTRKFIVVAADITACLVRGWTAPGRCAAELAVRCLLDQAEITEDIYELDLPEDWRAQVEEVLLEDADSEALFSDGPRRPRGRRRPAGVSSTGSKPYDAWGTVPPYACSGA